MCFVPPGMFFDNASTVGELVVTHSCLIVN